MSLSDEEIDKKARMKIRGNYNFPEDLSIVDKRKILIKAIFYLDYPEELNRDSHADNANNGFNGDGGSRRSRRSRYRKVKRTRRT